MEPISIVIYLLGCVISYFMLLSQMWNNYIKIDNEQKVFGSIYSLTSWLGVVACLIMYVDLGMKSGFKKLKFIDFKVCTRKSRIN